MGEIIGGIVPCISSVDMKKAPTVVVTIGAMSMVQASTLLAIASIGHTAAASGLVGLCDCLKHWFGVLICKKSAELVGSSGNVEVIVENVKKRQSPKRCYGDVVQGYCSTNAS
jgi:hypothetical protein